jgi:hypothetical protein
MTHNALSLTTEHWALVHHNNSIAVLALQRQKNVTSVVKLIASMNEHRAPIMGNQRNFLFYLTIKKRQVSGPNRRKKGDGQREVCLC